MILFLKIINALLMGYLLLLSLRIILTWFQGFSSGKAFDLLSEITEPYLSLFYRLKFLRKGMFDFTPIAAILVLVVLLDLINALLFYGRITFGFFFAAVLSAVWSGVSFVLLLFLIVGVIRVFAIIFRRNTGSAMLKVVDILIQPAVALVMKIIQLGKRAGYTQYLLLTVGFLFVFWLLGGVVTRRLVYMLQSL
ncbi:MAG: YggT family protein [Spirochaetes bacterium]|nr:YggT family protein [Spirochaetota bacterium]